MVTRSKAYRLGGRAVSALLFGILTSTPAAALDPSKDLTQYRHTAWRVRDGGFPDVISAITQTTDGYLWIATHAGLVRFDGVRFQPWLPDNGTLPSSVIVALGGGRDGSLWIGTEEGLARWKDHRLTTYGGGAGIVAILEDRRSDIWVSRHRVSSTEGALCRVVESALVCYGARDGLPDKYASALADDAQGHLWIGGSEGLCRWTPTSGCQRPLPSDPDRRGIHAVDALVSDASGALWIGQAPGSGRPALLRFAHDTLAASPLPDIDPAAAVQALFVDRDRALWIGTRDRGVYRVTGARVDHFGTADGLSGNYVMAIHQDREGNLWIGTRGGLDKFQDVRVPEASTREGLPVGGITALVSAQRGAVWVGHRGGLTRLAEAGTFARAGQVGIPGLTVTALLEDCDGRLWVGASDGLFTYGNGRLRPILRADGSPIGVVEALAEDANHSVWALTVLPGYGRRLARVHEFTVQEEPSAPQFDRVNSLAADRNGGLWLGLSRGEVGVYRDGSLKIITLGSGVKSPFIGQLLPDADGSVWAATDSGLFRIDQVTITRLDSRNGLPCDAVIDVVKDDASRLWLSAACGIFTISPDQLERWTVDPTARLDVRLQETYEAAHSAQLDQHAAVRSQDGRLWFLNNGTVRVVDPRHIERNNVPPAVHIEQIVADRRMYRLGSRVELPARTRDLEIDYTATSFVEPQRVRFRYRLEGRDDTWQEPGARRQAFYNDLRPGTYRFRVIASNNDGVWNEAGASLDFAIAPAYHQTAWFRTGIVVAVLALVWAMYTFRVRQLAHQFDARLQERVTERTRIARELHDTLLQSFHGVMFRFQAAANVLPDRPLDAKQRLETALKHGSQAIREGRDAVQGLRDSTAITNDLAVALRAVGEELAGSEGNGAHGRNATVDVLIQGTPQALRPIIRDDIYRIGGEALRNAFRHARARRIEVEIRYDARRFQLRVRDDGQGIGAGTLDAPRDGHFGLPGMRERAEQIGGQVEVWSEAGSGTEVVLTIPGAAVYASPRTRRHFWSVARR